MFTLLMMIVVCFLQHFGATKFISAFFDFRGEVRAYILGISDEIEVATIVYDEATILAVKAKIS